VVTAGAVTIKADDVALPNAATVVAPAPVEAPALTERQFSTTQKSPPSASSTRADGAGLVIGVAAASLFVGLIATVMLLRSQREDAQDQSRALPKPLPVAVHQPNEPKLSKPKTAPSSSATAATSASAKPLIEFLPGDAPPSTASSPTPVAGTPSPATADQRAAAAKPDNVGAPAGAAHPAGSASGPAGTGGTWVKPEWAIPDGEPIRRAPINE